MQCTHGLVEEMVGSAPWPAHIPPLAHPCSMYKSCGALPLCLAVHRRRGAPAAPAAEEAGHEHDAEGQRRSGTRSDMFGVLG
jgi:hypothetical protein